MESWLSALAVLATLAVAGGWYIWELRGQLRHQAEQYSRLFARQDEALDNERAQHNITRDRLYAAFKDGYVIPAAPEQPAPEDISLPDALAPIWEDWEGRGQEIQKNVLRRAIASGRTVDSLLVEHGHTPLT